MTTIIDYISVSANRNKVINGLGKFSLVGGTIVSVILFAAVILRQVN